MGFFFQSFIEAGQLILARDPQVLKITLTSLQVSAGAILLAAAVGVPGGFVIGITPFKGRGLLITFLNTLMALPTVVIGLAGYGLISRQGLLGFLQLLFTPTAMLFGQCLLATPIIMALTISAIQGLDPRVQSTALVLGASSTRAAVTMLAEARFAVLVAIITGFGRIIGEVGAAMMLGGNIKDYTRTLSTAIALETSKGEFGFALALGLILMSVALGVNFLLRLLQRK